MFYMRAWPPATWNALYQVDLRLNAAGYRRFDCSANGKPILALTFEVGPLKVVYKALDRMGAAG